MATNITMPKLSDTMTEGRFIGWKKSVGESVARGEVLAEVETDKATMELESYSSGILLETRVQSGEMVPVGTVIGIIGSREEQGGEQPAPLPPQEIPAGPPAELEDEAKEIAGKRTGTVDAEEVPAMPRQQPEPKPEAKPEEKPEEKPVPKQDVERTAPAVSGQEKASPMVRRLAREKKVDLVEVPATGPEGRILREDLERFLAERDKKNGTSEAPRATPPPMPGDEQPLSRMRGAIARVVSESWQTIPHFTVTVAIDMTAAERVRHELKSHGIHSSVNDFVIKACAMALGSFPVLNASFAGDRTIPHTDINIGFAVSIEDGLLVPVVRGCQNLTLQEISSRSRSLAERARSGQIGETDLSGGTFSISNLGMFAVEQFMAIILPPQGAILAVAAIVDQVVSRNGDPVVAQMMKVTLSADHRLVDGAYAARFLSELKKILENPVGLLL